jgi:MoxR-like ATPase
MLGEDSVVKLDATSTTKAGAENLLLELDAVPPVLIIEEIEKCNPVNLPWLLGVMDDRAEIVKTNARIGSIRKEARCLVLATVNNLDEFKAIMAGALASRFKNQIYCPRPSRKILAKILLREVKEIAGDPAWIKPALDWCLKEEKTNDPRRVCAILDGREKLLTGEYQADMRAIRQAQEEDGMMD